MPKLNAIRFTHLEYNNSRSVVTDQILNIEGTSTLLKMENGGGKSVMTQMLLAPYVSGKRRNFPKRRFADYFRSEQPTFIVQEWEKDAQAGFFSVGLMARKNTRAEEEASARIDLYAWVSEYDFPDESSLAGMRLLEKTRNGRKTYLNFAQSKKMLEELEKNRPGRFNLYNLAVTGRNRAYQEKLKELGIEQAEWEQMRQFNLEESGLSTFCETYDTEEKLIRKVLLPAAAEKIDREARMNEDQSHIERFQKETAGFISLQRQNRQLLEQQAVFAEFADLLEKVREKAGILAEDARQKNSMEERIAALGASIQNALQAFDQEAEEYSELIEAANDEIRHLDHEMLSIEWYRYTEQKDAYMAQQNQVNEQKAETEKNLEQVKLLLNQLACAREAAAQAESGSQAAAYQEKARSARLEDEEIIEKRNRYGSRLHLLYSGLLEEKTEITRQAQEELEAVKNSLEEARTASAGLQEDISACQSRCSVYQDHIEQYFKKEQKFLQTGVIRLSHSLTWTEDAPMMEEAARQLEEKKKQLEEQLVALQEKAENLKQETEDTKNLIHEKELSLVQAETALEKAQEHSASLDQALIRRKALLSLVGLEEEHLWNQEKIDLAYREVLARHAALESSAAQSIADLARELKNLKTGSSIELSDEVQAVFDRLDLKVQTGAQWLRNSRMKDDRKIEMVQKHPFFPYSLILDQKDSEKLLEELKKQNLYVSAPLLFCSREMLSHPDHNEFSSLSFYLHFNHNLIFPEQLEEMIRKAENEKSRQENFLALQKDQQQNLRSEKKTCDEDHLRESDLIKAQEDLDAAEKKIETLKAEKNAASRRLDECRQEEKQLNKELEAQKKAVSSQQDLCSKWNEIVTAFENAVLDAAQKQKEEENLAKVKASKNETEKRIAVLEQKLPEASAVCAQAKEEQKKVREKADQFESFSGFEPAKGSLEDIQPRFDSLSQKLSASQYSVYQSEYEKARKNAREAGKRLNSLLKRYQFENEDWKKMAFSQEEVFEQENRRDGLLKQKEELNQSLIALASQISRLEGLIEANENQMLEKAGTSQPLAKKECRQMDLQSEKKRLEQQLNEVAESKEKLLEKSGQFKQTAQRIARMTLFSSVPADEDLTRWSAKQLDEKASSLIVEYDHLSKTAENQRRNLDQMLSRTMEEYRPRQQVCFDVLRNIQNLLETPLKLPQEIEQKQQLLQNWMDKTKADLRFLEDNRRQLHQMLLDYVRNLHVQLKSMDQDTTITIDGSSRKMLTIEMKEWEELEPVARVRLESFLNELIEEVEADRNREDLLIQQRIQPGVLYDQMAEIQRIGIKLYKIEEDRQTRISWNQAGRMSGAEGFLCAFVVVSALLNYQRKDTVSRIYGRKASHTMILDNPFAYVQSGHIIRALMSLCETTGTQLVAFSNVGNADVINAFKNIYSLRMIPRMDEKNHLFAEHEKTTLEGRALEPVQIHIQESLLAPDEEEDEEEQISLF